uniref:C-type lectin domain-containing protein n=1 Tax=Amphilophus citrinellus TaxID=61819 RepID=A0A3Q0TG00_AMPCI
MQIFPNSSLHKSFRHHSKAKKPRDEALKYCQENYIDLAPIRNEQDNLKLMEIYPKGKDYIWFGLERNLSDKNKWMWSGGGEVTWFFWDKDQPDNRNYEDCGLINEVGGWHDAYESINIPFFCYKAEVVQENKTWEEALEYCREQYDDLASVASETEMLLIQKELKKHRTTEHVWIGLRFLSRDWLWVDGQEMDHEAWGQGGKPSCPDPRMKCAGLQVTGVSQGVWKAHDCEKRLNFICY